MPPSPGPPPLGLVTPCPRPPYYPTTASYAGNPASSTLPTPISPSSPCWGEVSAIEPPILHRPGGVPWTHVDAIAAGIITADGRLAPWGRPRITVIVGKEVNEITSPNHGSSGPHVRQFATVSVRLDDGTAGELAAYWHVPADHLVGADVALTGLTVSDAHEWLAIPLRRRVEADARVLCAGGVGLDFRCGEAQLRLEPASGGEVLLLEGVAGHCMAAGPAMAALGNRAAMFGGDLVAVGGGVRVEILGLAMTVVVDAADGGGLQVRCVVNGVEEIVDVEVTGGRTALADIGCYMETLGELSVAADGGVRVEVPGFGEWRKALVG